MKAKIYLQYSDYGDGTFAVDENYYNDGKSYIDAITEDYNKNKDIVTNSILDMLEGSGGLYSGTDGNTYSFAAQAPQKEEKYAYSKCDGVIFNENGEDESVDSIVTNMASRKQTVYMISLDRDTSDEEFEEELSLWVNEHNGINAYRVQMGDEWAWANEPFRDVFVSFRNKMGEIVKMGLKNCRILDIVDNSSYILYIENIEMANNLDLK